VAKRISDGGYESLELSIAGTTDKLTVKYFFSSNDPSNTLNPVQQVKFADGTTWDLNAIKARVFAGTSGADSIAGTTQNDVISGQAGADTLYGRTGDDALNGGDGDDQLYGEAGNDTLDGGAGNDWLDGNVGNNVYLFGRGDGQDVIAGVNDTTAGKLNTVQFKAGVSPSEVVAKRISDSGYESLELSIAGTADKLTVRYFFSSNDPSNTLNPVQQVKFADGTTWDLNAIKAQVFAGTSGADSIAGTTQNDVISGQAGADTLYGRTGDDALNGGDGDDQLYGEAGNDTLDGGAGNDWLDGNVGNNVYLFGRGDGQDVIAGVNDTTAGKLNTVQFKAGVSPSDVVAKRISDSGYESLELSIAGTTDKLTVKYFFSSNDPSNTLNPVQQVKFADGTTWDLNAIKAQVFAGTSGADSIAGTTQNDVISGQAGADTLYGRTGDDALNGGDGDDQLYGEAGNDTLDGGAGNDTLAGAAGADVYRFAAGYGVDTIQENDSTAGVVDAIQFAGASPILQSSVTFAHVGSNLEVRLNGTGDKLVLQSWYSGTAFHVEEFRFTDGSVLTDTQVQAMVSAMAAFLPEPAGATDDRILGRTGADTLSTLAVSGLV
uniref:calcium-binding protein n=1 Tax=Aquabacterium sp. TaxID=1872578 RepID=UPI0037834CE7